ncbi:MAG: KH domain-containing protein [Atribacterota bacterium]
MFILPENPPYYDPEILTDTYERDIAGEIIREKIWDLVRQEVPYGVEVRVEEFKERGEVIYIQAIIYVERESHKGILIGDKGKMIKKIGQEARKDLQLFLGKKVYLDLWVKTLINWRKKSEVLKRWGYQSPSS